MFEVYPNKILIEPIKSDMILEDDNNNFEEMGIVVQAGKGVKFAKVGDTLFFVKWGVEKTPEINGISYFVVPDSAEFIIGRIGTKPKKSGAKKK